MTYRITPTHHRIQRRACELLIQHPARRPGVVDNEIWSQCVKQARIEMEGNKS